MRICIFGAGATGGHFAVRLTQAGHDVSVVARGEHLAAIRSGGLRLRLTDRLLTAQVVAESDAQVLGKQDVVIVATKATALPAISRQIAPLIGHDTLVVFPQNGMTWWYPQGLASHCPPPPPIPVFKLADQFLSVMKPQQVLGGIIYSANALEAPGVIRCNSPDHNRLDIATIDGREEAGVAALRKAFDQANILSPDPGDIRAAVWTKLLNNMSGSTIALVTGSTSESTRTSPALSETYRRIVREGLAIAAAHGFAIDDKLDPDRMLARLLNHKPSLLQDYEQGRPMEIAEIVLAPLAFARARQVATPTLDTLAAIVTKLAADRNLIAASDIAYRTLWAGTR